MMSTFYSSDRARTHSTAVSHALNNFYNRGSLALPKDVLTEIIFKSIKYLLTPWYVLAELKTVSWEWNRACCNTELLLCNFVPFEHIFCMQYQNDGDDGGFKYISHFPASAFHFLTTSGAKLQALEISNYLREKDWKLILKSTPHLQRLSVGKSMESICNIIAQATQLKNLKIDVGDFQEEKESLSFITNLLLLEEFDASIDDEADLSYISRLTRLTSLALNAPYHSGEGLMCLTALQQLKTLRLEIERPYSWEFTSNFCCLEKFCFSSNSYECLIDLDLRSIIRLTTLQHLEIKPCEFKTDGFIHLSRFVNMHTLSIQVRPGKELPLENISHLIFLRKLKIGSVSNISCVSKLSNLVELHMRPKKGDLLHLANLRSLSKLRLESIDFKGALDDLYSLNSLEKIFIVFVSVIPGSRSFPITDHDMYATASLTKLHYLKIDNRLLTSKGQRILANLHNMKLSHFTRKDKAVYRKES